MTPEPLRVRISDARIDDLRARLARTRFAPDHHNDDWHYGVPTPVLAEWVAAWQDFDWRAAEERINRYVEDQLDAALSGPPSGSRPSTPRGCLFTFVLLVSVMVVAIVFLVKLVV